MKKELIDTQWDVNATKRKKLTPRERQLIDTQWDVNVARNSKIKSAIDN